MSSITPSFRYHILSSQHLCWVASGISCFFLGQIANIIFSFLPFKQRLLAIFFTLLIGFTGAGSISLLNTTTNDTKMAMLVIIAFYCVLKSLVIKKQQIFYLFSGAFIIGFCAGCKLPALCFNLALFLAFLFSQTLDRRHVYLSVGFAIFSAIGFLTINGYWMYHLYMQFQNPIFPLYNNFFHSDYTLPISFNILLAKQPIYLYHLVFIPFFLAVKNTLTSEVLLSDIRFGLVFILMLFFIIKTMIMSTTKSDEKNRPISFLFIFFFSGYFLWLIIFFLYRYVLPLELISGLLIVYLCYKLFSSVWIKNSVLAILLIIALTTTHYPVWGAKHAHDKTYFSLSTIPSLPAKAHVLLTSVPLAYTIPFFPKDTRFTGMPFLIIGISDPTEMQIMSKKYLVEVMKATFHQINATPTFILSYEENDRFDKKSKKVLSFFNLAANDKHCQLFTTNVGHHLSLCPLLVK